MGRKSREQLAAEQDARDTEINAKVDAQVAQRMAGFEDKILAQLAAIRSGAETPAQSTPAGDKSFASNLALAIAQLSDPTNKRRVVAPEVMKAREEARERMTQLLAEAFATGQIPVYIARQKMYLKEVKVEPQYQDPATKRMVDQEINWHGIPNEAMIPMNETAKAIHKEFLLSIGSAGLSQAKIAPWVLCNGEILRGHNRHTNEVGNGGGDDPRRAGGMDPRGTKTDTIRVLGTAAAPARIGA